jgi:uncharacterized protein
MVPAGWWAADMARISAAFAVPPAVEAAEFAAAFATTLRRAGLASSPDRAARLAQALRIVPPVSRTALYWTCRVVLVSDREQLPVFDAVFAAVFTGAPGAPGSQGLPATAGPAGKDSPVRTRPAATDRRPTTSPAPAAGTRTPAAAPPGEGSTDSAAQEREALLAMASDDERLHQMSFAELSAAEATEIAGLVRRLALSTPVRRSRRTRRSFRSSDRLDIRRTVRAAQRTGGHSARMVYARRRERPRRLVLLCDVSGSMDAYTPVYLPLLQGAAGSAGAEAFVFSTQLTRLTRALALHDPDLALARAAATAPDWAGGTRLAESLRRFIDGHGRRGLARGAVVVLFSDGWAQDEPVQVEIQMARLRRLAHRIIWVNPRKAAPDYRPLVGGMAAALPYCDAFVSGHSYAALAELTDMIQDSRTTIRQNQEAR